MSVAAGRKRDFFGTVSGAYLVGPADTGLIPLVPGVLPSRIRIQKIHVEVTAPTGAELWTFQDGAGIPIVPSVSAAAIAHFDFNFGPDGVPCSVGTAFVLNITGATGARGWITWEAARSLQVVPPNYSATVLADFPTAYYRLNEASGLVAIDDAAVPHNGTIPATGITYGVPGAAGSTALAFDGADTTQITTPPASTSGIDGTTTITLECWVNPTVNITATKIALSFRGDAGVSYLGVQNLVPYVVLGHQTPFLQHTLNAGAAPIGVWTYLAMTYDGTRQILYVNGVPIQAALWSHAFSLGTAGMFIGGYSFAGFGFPGGIDEVALYATALSPERIAQHYREGLAR